MLFASLGPKVSVHTEGSDEKKGLSGSVGEDKGNGFEHEMGLGDEEKT